MSGSSIFLINKNFEGHEEYEFANSWFFSPVIWSVLSDKYLPRDMFGHIQSMISFNGNEVFTKINNIMNNSDLNYERVCWELSNQQVFFTKDKKIVSDSIREFLNANNKYDVDEEDNISVLSRDHIIERWNEIADCIDEIDENEYPYFVFKNTSVDDSVESWFLDWDNEKDCEISKALTDNSNLVTEFVIIENGIIIDFIGNEKIKEWLKNR